MRSISNAQGGHEILHLATNEIITRRTVTEIPITPDVVKAVEALAKRDGMSPFQMTTKHEVVLYDASTAGVDNDENHEDEDGQEDDDDNDNDHQSNDEMDPNDIYEEPDGNEGPDDDLESNANDENPTKTTIMIQSMQKKTMRLKMRNLRTWMMSAERN
jgi:hypothetical protein